ncbi:hypothetical protein [Xanthomonas vasicola]|nr:hypothetical protein [Xanthomonas vasicola]MDO6949531.1 hypothetical protein [Xanthomonas vasicola]MDO6961956.1 hypothetical protein [Xanthomonas vasicola]MDO6971062.1 hypothetical protein [Xanthomonas vasicola]
MNLNTSAPKRDTQDQKPAPASSKAMCDSNSNQIDRTEEKTPMNSYEAKPDQATRTLLKRYGFKWSPSRDGQPWVRQLNNAGIYNGRQVFDALNSANIGDIQSPI